MDNQVDLNMYWQIVKRRKWLFILPAIVVILVMTVVSLTLPPKYTAEATILVEAQSIPEEMVQSTVTGFVEERIQTIKQVVMARQNLLQIIERFDLYPKMRQKATTEEVVATLRNKVTLKPVQTEVSNPRSNRKGSATIAFILSYEGKSPSKAAQVTSTLASQFMEENSRQREQKAETTVDFVKKQSQQLESSLDRIENKIAAFKDKHLYTLPSMTQLNMQHQQRIQELIDNKRNQIQKLKDRKIYLEGQLLSLEPIKYLSGKRGEYSQEEYLKQLKNEYLSLKAAHSSSHPDVIKLKKQVQALEEKVATRETFNEVKDTLEEKEYELVRLKETYSEKYPDVVRLKKEVRELREQYDKLQNEQKTVSDVEQQPENPAYIDLKTRIETTAMELESTRQEIWELKNKYQLYQRRLEKAPMVEQKYNALQREYTSLQQEYRETQAKFMEAQEAQQLERNRMSQKLRLVDPPAVPEKPSSPNRMALLLIGGVLGIGFGVGSGSLAEFLDKAVYDANHLARLVQKPVLASIPYMTTAREKRRSLMRKVGLVVLLLIIAGLLFLAIHWWVMPLDLAWIKVQQRFQNLSL